MATVWLNLATASLLWLGLEVIQAWTDPYQSRVSETITLDSSALSLVRESNELLLSVNLDSNFIQNRWVDQHMRNEKLLRLTSYLAPAYLRVGGTDSDKMLFRASSKAEDKHGGVSPRDSVFYMTGTQWTLINEFAEKAGLKLMFSLNLLNRDGNFWSSSNTKQLLEFGNTRGYNVSFSVGNEPDMFSCAYQHFITREKNAEAVVTLRSMLDSYPRYQNSLIVGPDTTNVPSSRWYLTGFLEFQNNTIDAVSVHHYYKKGGSAKLSDFYEPSLFNDLITFMDDMKGILTNTSIVAPLWLSETGTTSNGGTTNVSDRFVNGFMWLDKLGVAVKMGAEVICRQGLYGHASGLLDVNNLDPNPDWWLSVIYKRLVGNGVLNTTIPTGPARFYAQCSKTSPGSVVLFGVNLNAQETDLNVRVRLDGAQPSNVSAYVLTGETGLQSKTVLLNGKRLELGSNYSLPSLKPATFLSSPLRLPAYSLAFFVLEDVKVAACREN